MKASTGPAQRKRAHTKAYQQTDHFYKVKEEYSLRAMTTFAVHCNMHFHQTYSTRKTTDCLRCFILICADAKRPNG